MTARVCCSLIAALLCVSVCLSTTDAEGAAAVNGSIHLAAGLLPAEPAKPGVCPRKNHVAESNVCVGSCSHDRDCPNNQKCCRNGCGRQCMAPYREPEKPGVCPKNNLEGRLSGVCAKRCSDDSDCPNNQKCCSKGCGRQCMAPYREPEKPGVCPKNNLEGRLSGVCAKRCSDDRDCPNDEKCCSKGCGHQCMPPYKEKPGSCPKSLGAGACVELCSHDSDCQNNQKCCSNGCGHQCMAPHREPEKPGVCPENDLAVPFLVECVELCSHDSDCPNEEKCCSRGCGHQCMAPYREKPGVCPRRTLRIRGVCAELCSHDGDCPNDEKCCSNGCGHQCMAVYKEKPGVCPMTLAGVGGLCAELCVSDIDCPNDEKCCSSICGGRVCTPAH